MLCLCHVSEVLNRNVSELVYSIVTVHFGFIMFLMGLFLYACICIFVDVHVLAGSVISLSYPHRFCEPISHAVQL